MTDIAINLIDVTKQFANPAGGVVNAVDHINLQVQDGEFFSLLGPSGCGKTTTLRMVAGFEYPTQGEIYIHGKEMGQIPPYQRPINTVFQHYALFPHMTVGQNVSFGLEMKGIPKDQIKPKVKESLEMVRLGGMDDRRPKQLSGGQQQRVALARALVNHPEVLLLDEPLGALDLKLRKEMQLELKTIQRDVGITFIYVTHDQEEALTMSDRIAVMNQGKVLQVGEPSEIYEEPSTRFVAEFIGEANFLVGKVSTQNGKFVEVMMPGGQRVVAVSGNRLEKGSDVTVTVRCERIALKSDESHVNQFEGRVEEIVYIGTDTYYSVRLSDDQKVRVREQNADPTQRVMAHIGDSVVVSCQAEAARALED